MKTANVVRGFVSALIVLGALALQGCAMYPKYSETVYFADYRPYTAEGFTISPSSSGFTYESIGALEIVFVPGTIKRDQNSPKEDLQSGDKAWYELSDGNYGVTIYTPSYDLMVEKMVRKAKEMGADALLNFRIIPQTEMVRSGSQFYERTKAYVASGFAVKLTK